MTLSSIFNTNPWFNACFKFLMCITYSVLSCKLAISFSTFTVSILLGQRVYHYDAHAVLLDIQPQVQENILLYYLHFSFLLNLY